ncbi:MAG TPA: hypothetical protein VK730_10070 [Solirubrobacteraceae bacterium]|jgi:hypothetical protein|nr:hypothetical protein [Solirubrobacteraceae bacterium]
MTHPCPLPVDWLDYMQGADEVGMTRHLNDCGSCRTLLGQLEPEQPATAWAERFHCRTDAVWSEDRPAKPAPAEFWFSAPNFEMSEAKIRHADLSIHNAFSYREVDRTLVLILDTSAESHDSDWLDVVPVLSDIEVATDTDLIFTAEENTLGTPWRTVFSHQCKVNTAQLDTRVGALTDIGFLTLTEALAGTVAEERWGAALQGPDDPRARLDEHLEQAFTRLRTPWLLLAEAEEDCESTRQPAGEPSGHPTPVSHELHVSRAKILWLHPIVPDEEMQEYPLAAATLAIPSPHMWVLDTDRLKLHGKLEVDFQQGVLLFLITTASFQNIVRIRLAVLAKGGEHHSAPFTPRTQLAVHIAHGLTRQAVEKIGAEILP